MGILGNIVKAIKGGANEMGESIVETQAVRIYEQEIREAEEAIEKAKKSLTGLKATEITLKRKLNGYEADIADYEGKAIQALESGQEALAVEVAEHIAELEAERDETSTEYNSLKEEVNGINRMIKKRDKTIHKNKRELEKVKTVQELQKATSSISSNIAATHSTEHRVSKALDRVKAKQARYKDEMEAGDWMAEENDTSSIDSKLAASGIGKSSQTGNSVLERLKAKQAKG
ncbi:MAG: PspA/IM30 family protein [Candidatus Electrothrix sp. AR3]|nr:PspA/IM30 family protein [Candidatus Electrothrix sp. AR3]